MTASRLAAIRTVLVKNTLFQRFLKRWIIFTRAPTRENTTLAHDATGVESILGLIPCTVLVSDYWSSKSFLVMLNECYICLFRT